MLLLTILFIGIASSWANRLSECGRCPDDCEFGTVFSMKKNSCACICGVNPCRNKNCHSAELQCVVKKKSVCRSEDQCTIIYYPSCEQARYQAPVITAYERNILIDEGSAFTLEPKIESTKKAIFEWTKDDQPLPLNVNEEAGGKLSCYNANGENEGVYRLVVSDENGSDQVEFRVTVQRRREASVMATTTTPEPTTPTAYDGELEIKPDMLDLYEGQRSMLECQFNSRNGFKSDFNFIWTRDNGQQLSSAFYVQNEILYLDNVKESDSGFYKCSLDASPVDISRTVYVRVNRKAAATAAATTTTTTAAAPVESPKKSDNIKPLRFSFNSDRRNQQQQPREQETDPSSEQYNQQRYPNYEADRRYEQPREQERYPQQQPTYPQEPVRPRAPNNNEANSQSRLTPVEGRNIYEVEMYTDSTDKPQVEITNGRKERKIDEDVSLILEFRIFNAGTVYISKNDEDLPAGSYVERDGDLFRIHLFNLKRKDSGYYTCLVKNNYGIERGHIHLYVGGCITAKRKPGAKATNGNAPITEGSVLDKYTNSKPRVVIVKDAQVMFFNEGESFIIECEVIGTSEAHIYKSGQVIQNRRMTIEGFYHKLELLDLKPDDSGTYECVAENSYGQSQDLIKIRVRANRNNQQPAARTEASAPSREQPAPYLPRLENSDNSDNTKPKATIVKNEDAITLNEGDSYVIECQVARSETVEMNKSEGSLPSNHRIEASSPNLYKLYLYDLKSTDSGYYTCVASSRDHGSDRCFIYLNILPGSSSQQQENDNEKVSEDRQQASSSFDNTQEPQIKVKGPKEVYLTQGDSIDLECEATNGEITEFKKHENSPRDFSVDKERSKHIIRIKNMVQEDSGYYMCMGKNDYGVNRDYVYLEVKGN